MRAAGPGPLWGRGVFVGHGLCCRGGFEGGCPQPEPASRAPPLCSPLGPRRPALLALASCVALASLVSRASRVGEVSSVCSVLGRGEESLTMRCAEF